MSTAATEDYVAKRAELLANLVLTRRKDIRILPFDHESDFGIDLLVHTTKPITGLPANPYFGVQIKGTDIALDEREANIFGKQVVRMMSERAFILAPIVLMVFSMEGDRGYWGWILEPSVDGLNSPTLSRPERMKMTEINTESLEDMFSKVTSWFEAVGAVLRHKEKK